MDDTDHIIYPNRNSITSITIRPYILNHFWKVLSLSLLCWNCFFLKSLIQESLEAENYSQRGYQRLPWIFIFKTIIRRILSLVIVLNNQLRKFPQTYDVMWEKNIPRKFKRIVAGTWAITLGLASIVAYQLIWALNTILNTMLFYSFCIFSILSLTVVV